MKNKRMETAYVLIVIVLFFTIIQTSGCDKPKGPNIPTSPSGDTLSVSASPSTVVADGNSITTITAAVTGSLSGIVTFTTTLGTLSAESVNVDSNGNAKVTLSSAESGVATVTAEFGTLSGSTSVTFGLGTIAISGTGIGSTVADASASSESTTISFTLTDVNGAALSGVAVTLGSPTSNNGTASWSISTPSTNSSGVATSILTTTSSGSVVANAIVTITATATGAGSSSAQVTFERP